MGEFRFSFEPEARRLTCLIEAARFDATVTPEFKRELDAAWTPKTRAVTIDFAKVDFIDSSGVGALLSVHKRLPTDAEPATLVNVGHSVAEVIELLRLQRVFNLSTGLR